MQIADVLFKIREKKGKDVWTVRLPIVGEGDGYKDRERRRV